jgi:hypothetical protein
MTDMIRSVLQKNVDASGGCCFLWFACALCFVCRVCKPLVVEGYIFDVLLAVLLCG